MLDDIGPERVLGLVTDNGGGMASGRRVATTGVKYRHIVTLRSVPLPIDSLICKVVEAYEALLQCKNCMLTLT
jgi:hypothetical protein